MRDADLTKQDAEVKANRVFSEEQLTYIEKQEKICVSCEDLDAIEYEYDDPEAPHHGATGECGECNAEYYQEWGGTTYAANQKAHENHPEIKTV